LALLAKEAPDLRLRVSLTDGTVVVGSLLSASPDHVSLRLGAAQARRYPAEEIRSLHRARPRRGREWALASVGILSGTAILVGIASVPGVRAYFGGHAQTLFLVIFYAGVGLLTVALARTGLREWLTRWEALSAESER